ncbi:hypothetical protein ASF57_19255 [Methylobacterium sp. Leaf117]|nr:hypothetical protein ASF57_19255 [Methylobacterium sp. Leaf117]
MVLASGLMFTSFSIGSTAAAPGLTQTERMRASSSIGYAGNYKARKHHIRHRSHRHDAIHHSRTNRLHHTRNRLMNGDPNARNPSLPGYAQQRGNTSGGPRY